MLDPNPATLTIPNAGTNSNVLNLGAKASRRLLALLITAPATLPETVNIEVSADGGVSYGVLVSGASDIVIGPGKAVMVTEIIATHLRLKSGATAGQRDFKVIGATRSAARG